MKYSKISNSEVDNVLNIIIMQNANSNSSVGKHRPPIKAKVGSGAMEE
jgi:hypothetical protein